MAAKTGGVKNGDRNNRKAWRKSHGVEAKPESEGAKERHARHAEKAAGRSGAINGSKYTFPSINWGWFGEHLAYRSPNTRRSRSIDLVLEHARAKPREDDGVPLAIQANSEPKPSSAKPSRKSIARANAASRKNGR